MTLMHDDRPTERVERVEHIERVHHDSVATPSATNVNIAGTTVPVEPVWTVTRVVMLVFTVLEVLLLFRFVFKLAGANANQPLVAGLYGITELLVRPFQGIFPEPVGPPVVDIAALLAILFLVLIAALIVALARALVPGRAA